MQNLEYAAENRLSPSSVLKLDMLPVPVSVREIYIGLDDNERNHFREIIHFYEAKGLKTAGISKLLKLATDDENAVLNSKL